ncbi:hypothetical protein [Pseudonocardia sp. TMWB2A]|uniref:hypothetical protein n=1 Tax=Pseudonocardia sp. TMWB2A TaxID=687430 RepID=UPI00307E1386
MMAVVIVALLVTLVNLGLLGVALKLYTEVFKELAQRGRAAARPVRDGETGDA